jgi:hypothetical protein
VTAGFQLTQQFQIRLQKGASAISTSNVLTLFSINHTKINFLFLKIIKVNRLALLDIGSPLIILRRIVEFGIAATNWYHAIAKLEIVSCWKYYINS